MLGAGRSPWSWIVSHDLIQCDRVTIIKSQCPATTSVIICCKLQGVYGPILANQQYNAFFKVFIKVHSASNLLHTHSFHRGGAPFALCHDALNAFIKAQGDWKSVACVAGVKILPSPFPFNACHAGYEE